MGPTVFCTMFVAFWIVTEGSDINDENDVCISWGRVEFLRWSIKAFINLQNMCTFTEVRVRFWGEWGGYVKSWEWGVGAKEQSYIFDEELSA